MVMRRRGSGQLGCLFTLLIVAVVVYFAFNVGEVFWKDYQYQDRMEQEARFAAHRSDAVIKRRMAMFADSLGLPEGAQNVRVRRGDRMITIWAEYYVHIELPGFVHEFYLNPHAAAAF